VYHPWDEKDGKVDAFNELLDNTLNNLPVNHNLIMGGDNNAQVGRGDCEEYEDVMGIWGMKERNDKGQSVLEVYMTHNLCVMNTYFEHKEYWTYQSFNEEKMKHMIDNDKCLTKLSQTLLFIQLGFTGLFDCRFYTARTPGATKLGSTHLLW
jgi:hypothetical protein